MPRTALAQLHGARAHRHGGGVPQPGLFVLLALGAAEFDSAALWSTEEMYGVSIYPVTRAMIVQLRVQRLY